MKRHFPNSSNRYQLLLRASLLALLSAAVPASADVVWATKDCTITPCTISTGGTPFPALPAGQFRVIGMPIQWDATYFGTPQRFWVGKNGMNFADQQLSASNGDPGGSFSLALGLWYISVRTANMGPGNYSVFGPNVKGDPHISTMDGTHYDFQGAGEFVLLKNNAGFEVQSRMTPVSTVGPLPPDPHTGISACPSINTAAAVKTPRHRLSYQPGNGRSPRMRLRIDGRPVVVRSGGMTLNDGTRITLNGTSAELRITLRNGWGVRIVPTWWNATGLWYLDYDFTPATKAAGVAGPIAGDSWLPALADGSSVGSMPAPLPDRYKVLYEKFADSWRVNATTSLFDYQAGTSTATYTNPAWPGRDGRCRIPNTAPLPQISEAQATKICGDVHVPSFKKSCIADVMATGDRIFADGYVKLQGPTRYRSTTKNERLQERGD